MSDEPFWHGYVRMSPDEFRNMNLFRSHTSADVDEAWAYTDNRQKLLYADVDNVFLLDPVASREQVMTWAMSKWPSEHADYRSWRCSDEARDARQQPTGLPAAIVVHPYSYFIPGVHCKDILHVVELAKALAPTPLMYPPDRYCNIPWQHSVRNPRTGRYMYFSKLEEHGCYPRVIERELGNATRFVLEIVYAPKVTAKRIARREAILNSPAIHKDDEFSHRVLTPDELNGVARTLYFALPDWTRHGREIPYVTSRFDAMQALRYAITFHDGCCRRQGAYRQQAEFQALVRAWRNKHVRANSVKQWPLRMNQHQKAIFEQFCTFMDQEAARRLPKAKPPCVMKPTTPW